MIVVSEALLSSISLNVIQTLSAPWIGASLMPNDRKPVVASSSVPELPPHPAKKTIAADDIPKIIRFV